MDSPLGRSIQETEAVFYLYMAISVAREDGRDWNDVLDLMVRVLCAQQDLTDRQPDTLPAHPDTRFLQSLAQTTDPLVVRRVRATLAV